MLDKIIMYKNPDVVTRVIDDEVILLPLYKSSDKINCIYTLNKVAMRVWNLIDGKRDIAKIKKQILKEFDTSPKEVDEEMAKFLKELIEIRALKKRGSSS